MAATSKSVEIGTEFVSEKWGQKNADRYRDRIFLTPYF